MTSEQYETLMSRLDIIMRLLALSLTNDLKRQDQMLLLHTAGLAPRVIAEIIGTTPNTVSVTLSKMRKTRK